MPIFAPYTALSRVCVATPQFLFLPKRKGGECLGVTTRDTGADMLYLYLYQYPHVVFGPRMSSGRTVLKISINQWPLDRMCTDHMDCVSDCAWFGVDE